MESTGILTVLPSSCFSARNARARVRRVTGLWEVWLVTFIFLTCIILLNQVDHVKSIPIQHSFNTHQTHQQPQPAQPLNRDRDRPQSFQPLPTVLKSDSDQERLPISNFNSNNPNIPQYQPYQAGSTQGGHSPPIQNHNNPNGFRPARDHEGSPVYPNYHQQQQPHQMNFNGQQQPPYRHPHPHPQQQPQPQQFRHHQQFAPPLQTPPLHSFNHKQFDHPNQPSWPSQRNINPNEPTNEFHFDHSNQYNNFDGPHKPSFNQHPHPQYVHQLNPEQAAQEAHSGNYVPQPLRPPHPRFSVRPQAEPSSVDTERDSLQQQQQQRQQQPSSRTRPQIAGAHQIPFNQFPDFDGGDNELPVFFDFPYLPEWKKGDGLEDVLHVEETLLNEDLKSGYVPEGLEELNADSLENHRVRSRFLRPSNYPQVKTSRNMNTNANSLSHLEPSPSSSSLVADVVEVKKPSSDLADIVNKIEDENEESCTVLFCSTVKRTGAGSGSGKPKFGKRMLVVEVDESESPNALETTMETEDP